jgi:outer membrane protein assembly factor BamB
MAGSRTSSISINRLGETELSNQLATWCMLLTLAGTECAAANDWPDFRGPNFDGTVNASKAPIHWGEDKNIAWKTEMPGRGWSTPVIVDSLLWMTSAEEDGRQLFALSVDRKTGEIKHRILLFSVDEPAACNGMNSYASPSPVTDGRNVYVSFGTYGVAAIDGKDGTLRWSRDDVNLDHQEGPGSSPLLYNDRLVLHCDGRDRQYIAALDTATGNTAWQRKRTLDLSQVGDFARKAFTTPLLVRSDEGDRIISPAAQGCYCYDPATGREIWSLRYPGFSAVPRPVASDGVAFVVDGFANPSIYAVQVDGQDDITDSGVKWTFKNGGPATTSPVYLSGQLVFVTDKGVLVSLAGTSGEVNWRKRIGGNFSASPIVIGNLIYLFDRVGKSSVLRVAAGGGEPEEIANNRLDEGMMASPIVVGEMLYLRTQSSMYCIGASE